MSDPISSYITGLLSVKPDLTTPTALSPNLIQLSDGTITPTPKEVDAQAVVDQFDQVKSGEIQ